jgi:hypothetical protein
MSIRSDADSEGEETERVIDRSGDIDQRPPDERAPPQIGTVVSFPRLQSRETSSPVLQAAPKTMLPKRLPADLEGLAARLQKALDKHRDQAGSQLDALKQKIEAQEKRCLPPKLDGDLQQIRFQRQKLLIANGPLLSSRLAEERTRLADLEHFKSRNRLFRDAHYPESPLLGLGVLFFLILGEGAINGIFFAEGSEQGLLGGWLEALVLACTNAGSAFLLGRLVIPQIHRRNALLRTAALLLAVAGMLGLCAINLAGAHYRDFKAAAGIQTETPVSLKSDNPGNPALQKPSSVLLARPHRFPQSGLSDRIPLDRAPAALEPPPVRTAVTVKERDAILEILRSPFSFNSFMSLFLFVTGLCAAVIAAADGYRFDDPFPGYGRRHRSYRDARAARTDALNRILNQSNTIMSGNFQSISTKLEGFAEEMASLLRLHHAYAADRKSALERLERMVQDGEAELACHERLANKVRDRDVSELYALTFKPLPDLSEKHAKFYETQEKKLKALQKSLQKEQGDMLGIFDEASADFQRLLAECSRASLAAARMGEEPAGI